MPEMVDFRNRTTSEMNPRKGQNPSPFIFDFNSFSSNQNPKNLSSSSSSSFSFSEPVKTSLKTSSVSEDSGKNYTVKPRLVKHRRHLVNPRGKPLITNSSESKMDADFNPFRSKYLDSSNLEDVGKKNKGLPDQFRNESPFVLNPKSKGVDFSFDSTKEEGFVFGSNRADDSIENTNLASGFDGIGETMLPDEMRKLRVARGTGDNGGNSRTSQNDKDASFSFKFGKSGNLDLNSNANANGGLGGITSTALPAETRKLKTASGMGDNGSRRSIEEEFFVFGTNRTGSGENPNLSGGSGGISGSMLSEEMRKLKIVNGMGSNGVSTHISNNDKDAALSFKSGKTGNLNSESNSNSKNGLVGITGTVLPDEMRKLKITSGTGDNGGNSSAEGFVFGTNWASGSGDNPHLSSAPDGIYGSMLANEAGKSKVTSEMGDKASSNCTFQNDKNAAFTFKFFERQNLGLNSNSVFDGIAASVLPNEMRKLKIASRKGDYGSTNSTSQNAKNIDFSFKFGERGNLNSNTNNGSDEIVGSILPDEMQKLKIASETGDNRAEGYTSQNVEDLAFSFKFGERGKSSMNSNSNSTSSSGGVTGTMLPDEVRWLNIGSGTWDTKGNNCTSQNAKDASFTLNFGEGRNFGDASEKYAFIFGDNGEKIPVSNANSMSGLGDNNISVLPDELRKLKIGSTLKDSSRGASIAIFPGSGRPSISQVNSWDSDTGDGSSFRKDKDSTFHSKAGESVMFGPSNVSEKNAFVFGSNMDESSGTKDSTTFVRMGSRLPDEMRKLNIGSRTRDSEGRRQETTGGTHIRSTRLHNRHSAQAAEGSFSSAGKTEKGFSSSRSTSEEMESENLESRVPLNLAGDGTIPTTFTLQAKNLGDGLTVDRGPSVEPKVDSKSSVFVGPSSSSSSSSLSFPSSLSMGHGIQSASNIFAGFQIGNKSEFCFGITGDGSGYMNPEILKQEPSSLLKEQVFSTPRGEPFTVLHQTLEFSAKGGVVKNSTPKKRRGRGRQSASVHQRDGQNFAMKEKNLPEHPEPGDCSPMDFSPYEETLATNECSRGTSVASDECVHRGANNMSIDSQQDIPAESRGSKPLPREELNEENFDFWFKGHNLGSGCSESVSSGTWSSSVECSFSTKDYCDSKTATIGSVDDSDIATTKIKADFCNPKIEKPQTDGGEKFSFSLKSEDVNESNFTFAASPYSQGQSSRGRHHYKKKHGLKVGQGTSSSTPTAKLHSASPFAQLFPVASSSSQQGPVQVELGVESDKKKNTFVDKGPDVGKEFMATHVPCSVPPAQTINSNLASVPTASVTATALEACEKWRLRGNQAYANGDLSRAEDYYTRGANSFPPSEISRNCIKAIMLCYSNRAATRMSLGRMREALTDCMMAAAIDPSFLRVQLRAANCHLALGEIEGALKQFKKCAESENDPSSDKKIIADASDGLQKAQQVGEYMDQSAELLRQRTSVDATNALDIITEALLISPYSERLLEMKAEALLVLQKYEEVIQLCEQTQDSAAKNSSSTSMNTQLRNVDDSANDMSPVTRVWRSHLISKSYFQLGRLEEALDLLQKQEQMDPLVEKNWSRIQDSLGEFAATVRELLRHKAAGNEAFQAGRHLEAVEHYTAALTCNVESRPFTAICFCNRAAAYQALGQITDAIADCSLAIALDPNYPKAISRRATLHEMIRDYGQTQNDLQRLIPLLEKQIEDRANQSGILSRSGSSMNDLKQARLRLAAVEEEARKEIPLDMYLILGIEASGSASDVKKAYRKAALRHHPDKACQFLARNENGDDKLWKEIAVEVHKDADRLFKMIGEAYAIISDPIKRSRYDLEEDIRNVQKKGTGSSTSQASADVHGSSGSSRRQWKAYGAQHHQWSDSNRYS